MTRTATNHILGLIEEGLINPKDFLQSLMQAMSEAEVQDNLEYVQRVEAWPNSIRLGADLAEEENDND